MANLPTFNGFSFNESGLIAERILFKSYAERAITRANINRREGVKLLGSEFGEKEIVIEGKIIKSTSTELQTKVDELKSYLTIEEGDLQIETGRTFAATVKSLVIPDEHYNQSMASYEVTFICSNPYSEGQTISQTYPVTSGLFTLSGNIYVSGTMFTRPTFVYTPAGAASGNTNIKNISINHTPTGQTVLVSGFGNGLGLSYANPVTINYDTFEATESSTEIDSSGAFSKWEPGTNGFTVTVSGRYPGGSVQVTYRARYL